MIVVSDTTAISNLFQVGLIGVLIKAKKEGLIDTVSEPIDRLRELVRLVRSFGTFERP